jgi:hypothetical protein
LASVLPTRQLGNERVDESVQGHSPGLPEKRISVADHPATRFERHRRETF